MLYFDYLCAELERYRQRDYEAPQALLINSKQFDFKNRFHLSDREWEVFVLWGKGLKEKEIAEKLCVGLTTVKSNKKNAAYKIECDPKNLRKEYINLVSDENTPT